MVTRPLMPVPLISLMSTLCSFAMRRTSGDDRWRRKSSVDGVRVVVLGFVAGLRCGCARRDLGLPRGRLRQLPAPSRLAAGASGALAASPAPPITATTLLTGTVSPSLTLISVSTPAAGDGNLGIDLVGRDLEQRLVAVDRDRRPS